MTGEELRVVREKMGLTQAEFGEFIDRGKDAICLYENDRRPIPKILELCVTYLAESEMFRRNTPDYVAARSTLLAAREWLKSAPHLPGCHGEPCSCGLEALRVAVGDSLRFAPPNQIPSAQDAQP